jgi:hypothetical protein
MSLFFIYNLSIKAFIGFSAFFYFVALATDWQNSSQADNKSLLALSVFAGYGFCKTLDFFLTGDGSIWMMVVTFVILLVIFFYMLSQLGSDALSRR